jgi:SCY1-like protein 2
MEVIRKLGQRVEKEHDQFLRDSQRLEDSSTVAMDGEPGVNAVSVDFESLVGKANGVTVKADTAMDVSWDNDVWGSIFNSSTVSLAFVDLDIGVVDSITTAFHNPTFGIACHTNSA